jgi:hypothetical protein
LRYSHFLGSSTEGITLYKAGSMIDQTAAIPLVRKQALQLSMQLQALEKLTLRSEMRRPSCPTTLTRLSLQNFSYSWRDFSIGHLLQIYARTHTQFSADISYFLIVCHTHKNLALRERIDLRNPARCTDIS